MKHKSIQSQTTRPCCTEPTAKDMQLPFWSHLVANLIDVVKVLVVFTVGYALFIFFGGLFS
jgi:hypothetical protein